MSTQNKQRNQKTILDLASQPGNKVCADCKARLPRWASHNLGIFICANCANIHRKIGTHITKVKSLTMDDWTKEQVENMRAIGNVNSNRIYNPNEIRNPPPPNLEESERDSEIEQYIRAKYEYKRFFDRSALVASKLGPTRSSSLAQVPPSASLSQPVSVPRSNAHTTKPHVAASTASASSYTAPAAPGPPKPPHMLQKARPPQPSKEVWDDMNSLKGNNQNSSLPLQYQQQPTTYPQSNHSMQLPAVNRDGAMGANNYYVGGTASGMGSNPYPPNQIRTNPFAKPPSNSPYAPSSITSTFPTTQTMSSQPYGQQSYSVSQSSASLPVAPPYYNQQQQTSMQVQNPSFNPDSSSHTFPSAPKIQQPMKSSYTGVYPGPAQQQIAGHSGSGPQFLGMTTMQMQQQQQQMQMHQMQQHQIQQQQMQHQQLQPQQLNQTYHPSMQPQMMSHQVNNGYSQASAYPQGHQGGFPPQNGGGQWRAT